MPYCEHCGKEVTSPNKHCSGCGSKIPKKLRKEVKNDTFELVLILDESGSMGGKQAEVIESVNNFIHEQKKAAGKCNLSIYGFSGRGDYRTILVRTNLKDVPPFQDYQIHGMTALYDAIGKTINTTAINIKADGIRNVIFGIITDGAENSSSEFNSTTIGALIESKKGEGWKIEFMMNGISQERAVYHAAMMSMDAGETFSAPLFKSVASDYSSRALKYRSAGGRFYKQNQATSDKDIKNAMTDVLSAGAAFIRTEKKKKKDNS